MTSDWIRLLLLIPDSVSSRIMAAENETIPTLLTGGGFVFLAAIMGGLFVATVLTLIVVPALYVALFRIREPAGAPAAAAA